MAERQIEIGWEAKLLIFLSIFDMMENMPLNSNDNLRFQKALVEQITAEVELLNQFDPDAALKNEFELASLYDLQKYLDK